MRAIVRQPDVSRLRLQDRVGPRARVLFVGINPGVRSALTGHHFAGYSNRFWKLLFESGLVPERLEPDDDVRLPTWGLGITNLVPRPTRGVGDLRPGELEAGVRALRRRVRRWRPAVMACVGVTVFRALAARQSGVVALGLHDARLEGAEVFVLPNPSGRNANYGYDEMLAAFTALAQHVSRAGRTRSARTAIGRLTGQRKPVRG
jgi:TDG/mug DNA glycosylase family protein